MGSIHNAPLWRMSGGRTEVDLTLDGVKSVFVVFRKTVAAGLDPLTGVRATAGWSLATSAKGVERIEATEPLAGTLCFASGKIKAFILTPGQSVAVSGIWM